MTNVRSSSTVSVGGVGFTTNSDGSSTTTLGAGGLASHSHTQQLGGSATLASLGVQVRKTAQTSTMNAGTVALSNSETTRYDMRLPVSTKLKASFRKESWGDALVKVFKKELQTGDAEFDKLVYISTDTLDRTRAFLTAEVLKHVGFTIEMGGTLEIDDASVVAVSGGHDAPGEDDRTVVALVQALLAFAAQNP